MNFPLSLSLSFFLSLYLSLLSLSLSLSLSHTHTYTHTHTLSHPRWIPCRRDGVFAKTFTSSLPKFQRWYSSLLSASCADPFGASGIRQARFFLFGGIDGTAFTVDARKGYRFRRTLPVDPPRLASMASRTLQRMPAGTKGRRSFRRARNSK